MKLGWPSRYRNVDYCTFIPSSTNSSIMKHQLVSAQIFHSKSWRRANRTIEFQTSLENGSCTIELLCWAKYPSYIRLTIPVVLCVWAIFSLNAVAEFILLKSRLVSLSIVTQMIVIFWGQTPVFVMLEKSNLQCTPSYVLVYMYCVANEIKLHTTVINCAVWVFIQRKQSK